MELLKISDDNKEKGLRSQPEDDLEPNEFEEASVAATPPVATATTPVEPVWKRLEYRDLLESSKYSINGQLRLDLALKNVRRREQRLDVKKEKEETNQKQEEGQTIVQHPRIRESAHFQSNHQSRFDIVRDYIKTQPEALYTSAESKQEEESIRRELSSPSYKLLSNPNPNNPYHSYVDPSSNLTTDWTCPLFDSRRLPFQGVEPLISPGTQGRVRASFRLVAAHWQYICEMSPNELSNPDCFLHPVTKELKFPLTEEEARNALSRGFIPLTPGDELRYRIPFAGLTIIGAEHKSIYIGRGYFVHLAREKGIVSLPELCVILIESGDKMFTRGPLYYTRYVDFSQPIASRKELIRRALSSIGTYHYDLKYFNCQHATMSWRGESEPDVTWGSLILAAWIVLAAALIILVVLLCLSFMPKIVSPVYQPTTTKAIIL